MSEDIVTLEEAKTLKDQPEILFVDVREPDEIQQTGCIPGTINIPVNTVESVLKDMSPEEFQSTFNRRKPNPDTEIVFHCRMGGRAGRACNAAKSLGYTNVKNYKGGWSEWEQNL